MRVLYIGQYQAGSTSKMRGELLRDLIRPELFAVIDTNIPLSTAGNFSRSIGWRFYKGPLITALNNYILTGLKEISNLDLVWIDKGVFLDPRILAGLKAKSAILVHYTPDAAFKFNRSPLFFRGLKYYDYCITTKSFEVNDYKNAGIKNLIFCTQGYDSIIHKPRHNFVEKESVGFIGLAEPSRISLICKLIDSGIPVIIGGKGWDTLVKKNIKNPLFKFLGAEIYDVSYAQAISSFKMSLGLLSKKFPEKHTTRTFEIPACGTALLTEKNDEILSFFNDEHVIFYENTNQLIGKIKQYLYEKNELRTISDNGHKRVVTGGFDYKTILQNIIAQIELG